MQNSFFTNLLQALRTQALMYGVGLFRIFDAFNAVAREMPQCQTWGHPTLTTGLKTDFPILLPLGEKPHHQSPGTNSIIENPRNLSLPAEAESILKTMFADHQRVVIEKEFKGGLSGSQVFLICPIRSNGIPELPTVVKMASVSLIQREWRAYLNHIRDRLPNTVGVAGVPVLPPNSGWGGLRYPLVGSGTFAIESLHRYCRHAGLEDIRFVLEDRLLKVMEQVMQYHRSSPDFCLQASYDHILPFNLLIKPASVPPDTRLHLIRPAGLPDYPLKAGDFVHVEGFTVTKVDLLRRTLTLDMPCPAEGPTASYCLRVQSVEGMASYQINQLIHPIVGVVTETRCERLWIEAQRALGQGFDLADEVLTSPDGTRLPNPLLAWPAILSQRRTVKVGCIHGDLNLENILVDPATRDASLIDIAAAREDHLLHDFLRLETEIVTKLIPVALAGANLDAGAIYLFYERLHATVINIQRPEAQRPPHPALEKPFAMLATIRETARKYLADPGDWTEYYQGLVIYLLGALKFRNLDELLEAPAPLPKQVAFWGAATGVELLERLDAGGSTDLPPTRATVGRTIPPNTWES